MCYLKVLSKFHLWINLPYNAGPEESEEEPTKLLVKGLPESATEDILILTFEDERRQGGGRVNSVRIDRSNSSGIVEFESAEGRH